MKNDNKKDNDNDEGSVSSGGILNSGGTVFSPIEERPTISSYE